MGTVMIATRWAVPLTHLQLKMQLSLLCCGIPINQAPCKMTDPSFDVAQHCLLWEEAVLHLGPGFIKSNTLTAVSINSIKIENNNMVVMLAMDSRLITAFHMDLNYTYMVMVTYCFPGLKIYFCICWGTSYEMAPNKMAIYQFIRKECWRELSVKDTTILMLITVRLAVKNAGKPSVSIFTNAKCRFTTVCL